MELHNRLRETRREASLTQARLAGAVEVTRQTIISIEKGKFAPSVKLALRIAAVLKVPIASLFWLE
ncbi:MAG: helix-turn-helix transcriptional regulator [Chloroflexota bacterium]|nr:helix-turn-helix transcriptional regulator [Chloroflexota bacterium]MDP6756952.1 helix-turn-helix transcriptional regulator [Chloroflexota bacterium]